MKNDKWNEIFEKFKILEKIQKEGKFEIEASEINEFREARLMAKFDNASQLPEIFSDNKLAILPIARGRYLISPMEIFCKFPPIDYSEPIRYFDFPEHIQSLSPKNIASEVLALNCAYISGILEDFVGDECLYPTISGKMSSLSFGFQIKNSIDSNINNSVWVDRALIEIDGAYEGLETLSIIEAKKCLEDDFVVRQLYYPYRRLSLSGIQKKIKLIFLVHTNNIFYLYEYKFSDIKNYNSLVLNRFQRYSLDKISITVEDIQGALERVRVVAEPEVPFPQADSFERVINLCELLSNSRMSKTDITENYGFNKRQTDYYANAGRYLGLIEIDKENVALTRRGANIISKTQRERQISFVEVILEHSVFKKVLEKQIKIGTPINRQDIVSIMKESQLYNCQSDETYQRRSSTVSSWINWITSLTCMN